MGEELVEGLESIMTDSNVSAKYTEYKQTEEYQNFFEIIRADKPRMSEYLIDMCIFGYYHTTLYENTKPELRGDSLSILEQPEKVSEPLKGDIPNMIFSYPSMEDYVKENKITEIKTIGQPLTFEEVAVKELDT